MAAATETIGDRLTAQNLFGRDGDLQVQGRSAASMKFEQPDDHDHAYHRDGGREEGCQPRAAPFQELILCPPGSKARSCQQRGCGDGHCRAKQFKHGTFLNCYEWRAATSGPGTCRQTDGSDATHPRHAKPAMPMRVAAGAIRTISTWADRVTIVTD